MRTSLIAIALLLLAGFALAFALDSPMHKKAPVFTFETLDGEKHILSGFKDKIIILNFWASWCPPCVKEFPRLVNIADEHGDKVVFIALSSDVDDEAIKHFIHDKNLGSNILIARDKVDVTRNLFGITQLPETLIIDHNLKIRARFIGDQWKTDEMEAAIGALEKGN